MSRSNAHAGMGRSAAWSRGDGWLAVVGWGRRHRHRCDSENLNPEHLAMPTFESCERETLDVHQMASQP